MTIDGLVIAGKRGRILGSYFRTDGENRPVVILCHGIPGNDQLHDFAYDLQEHGCHVLSFNYGGSWGSGGDYSLRGVIEDTNTVLDWVLAQEDQAVDRSRIYIIGHSLGGFAAANVFARRQEIAAAALISPANMTDMYEAASHSAQAGGLLRAELDDFCRQLDGVTAQKLIDEIVRDGESFRFENVVAGIGPRPVLAVRGLQDTITPAALCTDVISKALENIPGSRCEVVTYDAPHDYLNVRHDLRKRVRQFLDSVME